MAKTRRITAISIISALLALSSCSSSPEALEKSPDAVRQEKTYSANYQEVYRRLVGTARRCAGVGNGMYTSFQVDSDLFSELGYGEVAFSLQDMGARNYYWKAKIQKEGNGSKLSVVSGNTLAKNRTLRDVVRWADGDSNC
ncbi:hypothetical protein FB480_101843 [Agrobacterium vitis]|nr:hypothetical protein FB480_101843 [Agrobacterium vitis]